MKCFLLLIAIFWCPQLFAQTLIDPINNAGNGSFRVGGVLSMFKNTYDVDGDEVDADLMVLGSEIAYGINDMFDVIGQLGIPMSGDIEFEGGDSLDLDSGKVIGLGARAKFYQENQVSAAGYFLYTRSDYEFDGKIGAVKVKVDTELTELALGAAVDYAVKETIKPYAAIEIFLSSDGDFKSKVKGGGSNKEDFERDEKLNLKFGTSILFNSFLLRPELTLVGEKTFLFAGEFTL